MKVISDKKMWQTIRIGTCDYVLARAYCGSNKKMGKMGLL